jgi:hypothetical protein
MEIIQKVTNLVKKEGTKSVFIAEETSEKTIDEKHYRNATEEGAIKFFRRLGGTETVTREYTCYGYKVVKIVSTSPNKEKRTIREYEFISK